jgi:hypothetical protein
MFIERPENVQISLENLFKLIHDADTPLILHNPGFKKDSVVVVVKGINQRQKIPVMSGS